MTLTTEQEHPLPMLLPPLPVLHLPLVVILAVHPAPLRRPMLLRQDLQDMVAIMIKVIIPLLVIVADRILTRHLLDEGSMALVVDVIVAVIVDMVLTLPRIVMADVTPPAAVMVVTIEEGIDLLMEAIDPRMVEEEEIVMDLLPLMQATVDILRVCSILFCRAFVSFYG
jgi:hypothetical protein